MVVQKQRRVPAEVGEREPAASPPLDSLVSRRCACACSLPAADALDQNLLRQSFPTASPFPICSFQKLLSVFSLSLPSRNKNLRARERERERGVASTSPFRRDADRRRRRRVFRCRCSGQRSCSRSGSTSRARTWTWAPPWPPMTTTTTTVATLTAKVRTGTAGRRDLTSSDVFLFRGRRTFIPFRCPARGPETASFSSLSPHFLLPRFAPPENCGCDDGGARRPDDDGDGAQITGEVN